MEVITLSTKDKWERGYKVTVSISIPTGMLHAIDDFGAEHMLRGYTLILRKLIRYGLIYEKILTDQSLEKLRAKEAAKKVATPKKKKAKPKTPSSKAGT